MGALRAITELTASFRGADILVPCYHAIPRRERFAAQMAVLADQGFSILTLEQFTGWLRGSKLIHPPAALLTFDGCYDEQLENALPVLEQFQFPATFFPASAGLTHELPEVSAHWCNTLLALAKAGHTIGCHTHTHPDLTALSEAELQREVQGSKQILEGVLGQPVTAFCYPYGACNPQVAAAVQRAGFEVAFTVDLGGVKFGDDPYQLNRVPVLGEPNAGEFKTYLSGRFLVSGSVLLYWKVRERLLDRKASRAVAEA